MENEHFFTESKIGCQSEEMFISFFIAKFYNNDS